MDTRDNTYKTPLLVAVQAQLPGHLKRLLMAKVHSQLQFVERRFKGSANLATQVLIHRPSDFDILTEGQRLPTFPE